jgi:phosphotransferase system HPr (HPr) family protein
MQNRTVVIRNRAGIHCRPSSVILNTVNAEFSDHKFELVSPRGESCELNSIMGLLALCLACGDTATLTVEGPNEEAAADKIAELLASEFDFPPQK